MAANTGHMVSEFENSFQACLAALSNEDHFNVHDPEEIKAGVEQTLVKFLEMAKQMECFFLQKRLLLSAQKPEQIVREDINDLKIELNRKELLIQKHYEKIQFWQSLLSNIQGPGPRPPHLQNSSLQLAPPPLPPHAHPGPQQHPMSGMPGMPPTLSHVNLPNQPPPHLQQQQQQGSVMNMPNSVSSPMAGGMMQAPVQPPHLTSGGQQQPPSMQTMLSIASPMYHGGPPPHMQHQQQQAQQQQMGPPHPGMHTSGLQGPLAYLEKTTSNIGMPEHRQ